jgi:hypothetical protein
MYLKVLEGFMLAVAEDHRIHPAHISLYVTLFCLWKQQQYKGMIDMRRDELMKISKIVGRGTYQRCLRELHSAGYINYQPTFNRFENSKIGIVAR